MESKEVKIYTALFVILGIAEQLSNGLLKTNFSLGDLLSVFGVLMTYYGVTYGINSKWNSPSGMLPERPINTQGGKY